jgi:hypothetical protein
MVCNPRNRQYYEPDSYHINPYCLPTLVNPGIEYDGSLFCYLLCDENPHMEEKYPLGTQIEQVDPSTNMLLLGMVMDIPFPGMSADSPPCKLSYMVLFINGSTTSIVLQDMASLIHPPPVNPSSVGDSLSSQDSLLTPFLCIIQRSRTSMKGNTTRVTSQSATVAIGFPSSRTSTRNGRLGCQFTQSGYELG